MKRWSCALRDALVSGTVASLVSTLTVAVCGKLETGRTAAPTNATSHWVWGERAAAQDAPTLRYTALGYAIHHAASVFWATFYERWFGEARDRGAIARAMAGGAAVAALACFVDYRLTPERLTPGFEKRLSTPSLFAVYVAFGAGLAAGVLRRSQ